MYLSIEDNKVSLKIQKAYYRLLKPAFAREQATYTKVYVSIICLYVSAFCAHVSACMWARVCMRGSCTCTSACVSVMN